MTAKLKPPSQVSPGFERAARYYDDYAVLQRKVADEMLDRLHDVTIRPASVVDVGCGTGYCTRRLHKIWKSAQVVGFDLANGMIQQASGQKGWFSKQAYCQADAASLPLNDGVVDVVFSNLMLQWCDPQAVFAEFRRVLNNDGLLMFSSFGPDTQTVGYAARREDPVGQPGGTGRDGAFRSGAAHPLQQRAACHLAFHSTDRRHPRL